MQGIAYLCFSVPCIRGAYYPIENNLLVIRAFCEFLYSTDKPFSHFKASWYFLPSHIPAINTIMYFMFLQFKGEQLCRGLFH